MRALGEELRARWGQPLIVDNRPGGAMNVGTRACAEATPDGYTICITNADAMAYNQFLFKKLPFDPEKQLQPITNLFHLIHMLVVNSDLKVKTIDELIALSKAKPGTMSYLAPRPAAVPLHGDAQEGEGRRLGARAVPRRRRGGQRHPRRLDADRAVRRGQRHRAHPRRQDDAAGDDEQHPLAELPARSRCCRRPATRARRRAAGTACSRRPARRGRSSTSSRKEVASIVSDPDFRERHLTARSLVPAINTPEQFAEDIRQDRIVAEQVVKDAGLEPQ